MLYYVRKYNLRVVYDGFTLKRDDGSSLNVHGGEFNLGRDINITKFTWGMLRNELDKHALIPHEMDIEEVKMCKCKDMEVKTRGDLVFPHGVNFMGDIVLYIKLVKKTGMVGEVQEATTT